MPNQEGPPMTTRRCWPHTCFLCGLAFIGPTAWEQVVMHINAHVEMLAVDKMYEALR